MMYAFFAQSIEKLILIPVHFNIEPSEIRGFLRHTTMFLPEQLVTINEEQIIQTAGMIVSTDAIKKVDAMLQLKQSVAY